MEGKEGLSRTDLLKILGVLAVGWGSTEAAWTAATTERAGRRREIRMVGLEGGVQGVLRREVGG